MIPNVVVHERAVTIRFRTSDVPRLERAAKKDGLLRAVWIREVACTYASDASAVPRVTAGGTGTSICVRFSERDYARIAKAAHRHRMVPSSWIRGAVAARLNGHA